ncbi:hypothetical protein D3C73_1440360 [compost metagenome]
MYLGTVMLQSTFRPQHASTTTKTHSPSPFLVLISNIVFDTIAVDSFDLSLIYGSIALIGQKAPYLASSK